MKSDYTKLNENSEETRILKFMLAITSNLPDKVLYDNSRESEEAAYKVLDLAMTLNRVYSENWE